MGDNQRWSGLSDSADGGRGSFAEGTGSKRAPKTIKRGIWINLEILECISSKKAQEAVERADWSSLEFPERTDSKEA